MTSKAATVEQYLNEITDPDKKIMAEKLRTTILKHLPDGYKECMNYGMIGYVVPHSLYPKGYHCTPELPLPFMNIGVQKNSVNYYHMGIYMKQELLDWFVSEYHKNYKAKLDMGKSCMRFKKDENIPYALIGELVKKLSTDEYIQLYESILNKKK